MLLAASLRSQSPFAGNLKRAHARIEIGKAKGKIVFERFEALPVSRFVRSPLSPG